jgi:peptide/nickel transport system permease protein
VRVLWRDGSTALGTVMTAVILALATVGPALAGHSPIAPHIDHRLQPPSAAHWLGTDELGRDVFARIAVGARYSLASGVLIITFALVGGAVVGGVAGLAGGLVDEALMRLTELLMAFPGLILAMVVAFALGRSLITSILAMAIAWFPSFARLIRGMVLQVKERTYVESALAVGASRARILVRTILPQTLPVILVRATTNVGMAIILDAGLSYVGLGVQPPTPDWGSMIASSGPYLLDAWWLAVFPGLAIFMTVVGISLVGDGLQAVTDPELRHAQPH